MLVKEIRNEAYKHHFLKNNFYTKFWLAHFINIKEYKSVWFEKILSQKKTKGV